MRAKGQAALWGSIGGQTMKARSLERLDAESKLYEASPKHCRFCQKQLPFEKRHLSFCNHSCAARHNNIGRTRNPTGKNGIDAPRVKSSFQQCLHCGAPLSGTRKNPYCNSSCLNGARWKAVRDAIETTGVVSADTHGRACKVARRYLLETMPHRCSICGITEWNGQPVPLVADHINGDPHDHRIENLRLICNNCDALLPTYKSRNKGKGRNWRYRSDPQSL